MERLESIFEVDRDCPLSLYPRPQLVRDNYTMLNGTWQYAIVGNGGTLGEYDGEILVPFSPETALSGVCRKVMPSDTLYYRRDFDYRLSGTHDRVILHFDAVDYSAEVTMNGEPLGMHRGGYFPFAYDITDIIGEHNTLELKVTDPSDTMPIARGKQSLRPGGIFYTAQSGIWQSVWLEEVADNYIERLKLTPNIDTKTLLVEMYTDREITSGDITISLRGERVLITHFEGNSVELHMDEIELWTPETPTLYDITIKADDDSVSSYFAMRSFGMARDSAGYLRCTLNGKPYFMNGVLDQGYWSDGLLTPPSDEAMIYDIEMAKAMGFNMIRKHIKIEPLRWYYHCDRLGIIVWQDFVNGGGKCSVQLMSMLGMSHIKKRDSNYHFFKRDDAGGRAEFLTDIDKTIEHLYNVPSIAVWTPFNEGWGQFDAEIVADKVKCLDDTRLVDHASGWFDQGVGDFRSLHVYFMPIRMPKDERAIAVTEYGGYTLAIKGHTAISKRSFGYKSIKGKEDFTKAIAKLFKRDIEGNIAKGLCAAVYTQLSDVENEVNGLVTFDRAVEKIDREDMRAINNAVYDEFDRVTR